MEMASHFLEYHSQTVGAELATDERIFLDRPKKVFPNGFYLQLPYNNDSDKPELSGGVSVFDSTTHWNPIELQLSCYKFFFFFQGALMLKHGLTRSRGFFKNLTKQPFPAITTFLVPPPPTRSWWLWKPIHLHLRIFLLRAGLGEKSTMDEMLMLQKSQAPRNQPPVGWCINPGMLLKPPVNNGRNFYIYANLCNWCRMSSMNHQLVLLM